MWKDTEANVYERIVAYTTSEIPLYWDKSVKQFVLEQISFLYEILLFKIQKYEKIWNDNGFTNNLHFQLQK